MVVNVTGVDEASAEQALRSNGWDVEAAVNHILGFDHADGAVDDQETQIVESADEVVTNYD